MVNKPNNSFFQKLIRPLVFVVSLIILFIAFKQTPLTGDGPKVASAQSACTQYVTSSKCNQSSYDTCGGVQYDGNRAYYECRASQNPTSCTGRIYCQPEDRPFTGSNPTGVDNQGNVMKPTCDAVNRVSTFNTTTYDTCRDNLGNTGGNLCTNGASRFECYASQNNSCTSGGMVYGCPVSNNNNNQPGNTGSGGPQVVNCPTGTSPSQQGQNTIVCVANQNTNGNANANANNNNIANNNTSGSISTSAAQGGSALAQGGAGGSANVTINGAVAQAPQAQTVRVVLASGNTGVGTSANQVIQYKGMKQLPNTGLPTLAWAAIGLIPAGFGLKRFRSIKKDAEGNADFIWEDKNFKSKV